MLRKEKQRRGGDACSTAEQSGRMATGLSGFTQLKTQLGMPTRAPWIELH